MKRLTSLLLSGVLALSLSVPAFAADHIACTYNSYTVRVRNALYRTSLHEW